MPEFFKKNILSQNNPQNLKSEEKLLESPLDIPELESPLDTPELNTPDPKYYQNTKPQNAQNKEMEDWYDDYYNPVKTILTWTAPARPYRKKDRSFYTYATILIILTALVGFLLFKTLLLVGALFALAFLVYVLNFVTPEDVEYKLSTQGVTANNHFYHWEELDSFWFSEKDGFKILHILTLINFPGVLMFVLNPGMEEDVKRICARFIPFHEIAPKSTMDKWSEYLQKHIILENPHR